MFQAAIFDMDGLLVDSERALMQAWIAVAADDGMALQPHDYVAVVGRAAPESEAILAQLLGGRARTARLRERVRALIGDGGTRASFPPMAGAADLVSALAQRGVRCAVASSSTVHEIRHRLGHVDMLQHFSVIAGGNEVAKGKPDPAIYRLAAQRLGVAPGACLAFEDSENGARAALAAGAQVVVVPDLRPPPDDVRQRAWTVLESLTDALEHVPRWFSVHAGDDSAA